MLKNFADKYLVGLGFCALFFHIPLAQLIYQDPEFVFIGPWTSRYFWILTAQSFILIPAAVGALFLLVQLLKDPYPKMIIGSFTGYILLCQFNEFYIERNSSLSPVPSWILTTHFGPWPANIIFTLIAAVLCLLLFYFFWGYIKKVFQICTFASFPAFFLIYSSVYPPNETTLPREPVQMEEKITQPRIFFFTFEKIFLSNFIDEKSKFLEKDFPNLASLVRMSDFFTNSYTNASQTVYAIHCLYTGRKNVLEEGLKKAHPHIGDILSGGKPPLFVTDVNLNYYRGNCKLVRFRGFRKITGDDLIAGIYKTYLKTIMDRNLEVKFKLLDWRFDPRLIYLDGLNKSILVRDIGTQQFDFLIRYLKKHIKDHKLFVMHNFLTDYPVIDSSLLASRSQVQRDQDLKATKENLKLFDSYLGKFLAVLKKSGQFDSALIFIGADTGFDPYVWDYKMHVGGKDFRPPWDAVRIFQIIKWPGQKKGRKINLPIQQIDVLPTILQRLGMDTSQYKFDGRPILDGSNEAELFSRPIIFVTKTDAGVKTIQFPPFEK